MAKPASTAKALKPSKKTSQPDLKAAAPTKAKKTKQVEEPEPQDIAAEASSSKPKKEKKKKAVATEVEESTLAVEEPVKAVSKKEKKKDHAVVEEVSAEPKVDEAGGKRKRRKSIVAAEESAEKPMKKGESAVQVTPAKPKTVKEQKGEDMPEKKKKRKSVAIEEPTEDAHEKTKKKRKDHATVDVKAVEESSSAVSPAKADAKSTKTKSKATAPVAKPPTVSQPSPKETKKGKAKGAASLPTPAQEPEDESAEEDEAEQEQGFFGFSSDDDDSSDEEMVDDIPGIDIGKLPTVAKDDETVKRRLEKAKRKPTEDRGVIHLGRIPHGFYEDQLRAYFSQFGTVTRLRLSRSKKTGKSKHYGFIEFDSSSVAKIVAETMDNYLLMGHILTCKIIPKDQVHPELWVGANRKWRAVPRDRVARVAHNKPRTDEEIQKADARLLKRQEERKRKLKDTGIEYDFEAVAYKKKPKPTEA